MPRRGGTGNSRYMRGPNATPPPELVEELRRVRASADTTTLNSTTATRGDGPT